MKPLMACMAFVYLYTGIATAEPPVKPVLPRPDVQAGIDIRRPAVGQAGLFKVGGDTDTISIEVREVVDAQRAFIVVRGLYFQQIETIRNNRAFPDVKTHRFSERFLMSGRPTAGLVDNAAIRNDVELQIVGTQSFDFDNGQSTTVFEVRPLDLTPWNEWDAYQSAERRKRLEARIAAALQQTRVLIQKTDAPMPGLKGTFYTVVVTNGSDDDLTNAKVEITGMKDGATRTLSFQKLRRRGDTKKTLSLAGTKRMAAAVVSVGGIGSELLDEPTTVAAVAPARCPSCSGRGSHTCPACGGKGFTVKSRSHDGGGYFRNRTAEQVPCTKCKGGRIECKACGGKGR